MDNPLHPLMMALKADFEAFLVSPGMEEVAAFLSELHSLKGDKEISVPQKEEYRNGRGFPGQRITPNLYNESCDGYRQ